MNATTLHRQTGLSFVCVRLCVHVFVCVSVCQTQVKREGVGGVVEKATWLVFAAKCFYFKVFGTSRVPDHGG